jgi:CheY-like chemotaxis protein
MGEGDGMNGRPAVLIVEDNADILHQTSKILSRNGCAVTMAASLTLDEIAEMLRGDNISDSID